MKNYCFEETAYNFHIHIIVYCKVLKRMKQLYQNDPSKVDIWVGGLLETHSSGPGDLFTR